MKQKLLCNILKKWKFMVPVRRKILRNKNLFYKNFYQIGLHMAKKCQIFFENKELSND